VTLHLADGIRRLLRTALRARCGACIAAAIVSGVVACDRNADSAGSTAHTAPAAEVARRLPRAGLPATLQPAPLTERAWWNQPDLIGALTLTAEQRARMDALLLHSLATQRAAQQQQQEQQRTLKEALEGGNWDAARQAAAAAADGMTTAWRTQTTLKIDVLALLDPSQQQLLKSQYRQVLRQTSVLGRLRSDTRRQSPTPAEPGQ
jgi:hypothetical protein